MLARVVDPGFASQMKAPFPRRMCKRAPYVVLIMLAILMCSEYHCAALRYDSSRLYSNRYSKAFNSLTRKIAGTDKFGNTILHRAARDGKEKEVAKLMRRDDLNFNAKNAEGQTSLYLAAANGHVDVVMLLEHEADVNKRCMKQKWTALHVATFVGQVEVVEELLTFPLIDINKKDRKGRTPLLIASGRQKIKVVRDLLNAKGIDFNAKANDGSTALHFAALAGEDEIVSLLLPVVDVNVQSTSGHTALHLAAYFDRPHVVEKLLQSNEIDLNLRDEFGDMVLHAVVKMNNLGVLQMLLPRMKDPNAKDLFDRTAWQLAIDEGRIEIIKYLVQSGYVDGKSAAEYACKIGSVDVLTALFEINWPFDSTLNCW